jgi:hypothetical protein
MSRRKSSKKNVRELKYAKIKAAGNILDHYPNVKALHFDLTFVDLDNQVSPIHKNLSYRPQQPAFFEFDCPYWECVDGGFNLRDVVHLMLRGKKPECSGDLRCRGWQDRERVGRHHCYCTLKYRITAEYH